MVGRADYNEWGQITYKDALDITSSYRRIYPQLSYTGHDWDDVLGMYYAKARFYDADTKRFVAIDPIKGNVTDPLSLVSYIYCVDNPLRWVDPLGMTITAIGGHQLQITPVTLWDGEEYVAIRDLLAACNINLPKEETSPNTYKVTTPVAGGMDITATMDTSKKELTLTALSKRPGSLPKTVIISGTQSPKHAHLPYHMTMYNGNYFMKIECFKAAMKSIGFDAQLKPTEGVPAGKQLVTKEQLLKFGWKDTSDNFADTLNDALLRYKITDRNSIAIFMATMASESGWGSATLEIGSDSYFESKGYDRYQRGAGYIQLTGRDTHLNFLASMNDSFSGQDTATYIAENYPMEASAWYWSKAPKTGMGNLNAYVEEYGASEGLFLATQYFVNGFPRREVYPTFGNDLGTIRAGADFRIEGDKLYVNGKTYQVFIKWQERKDNYEKAMDAFAK